MEECINACSPRCSLNVKDVPVPKTSRKTYVRGFCLLLGLFVFLVWFWHNSSPCRPPLGVCGRATRNGIRTLDLLDEAQILTETSFLTVVCGIIEAELSCLGNFFQTCLSSSQKENRFYSSLHLEGISAKQRFCETGNNLEHESSSLSNCWFAIRQRRNECVSNFFQSPGGRSQVIMDSIFDDLDTGVYRKEFCWALREAVICGLSVSRQACGERPAKSLYHLTRNITNIIFTNKCDESLRPDWEDSTLRLMRKSFRPMVSYLLQIVLSCLIIALAYIAWKCSACIRRWLTTK